MNLAGRLTQPKQPVKRSADNVMRRTRKDLPTDLESVSSFSPSEAAVLCPDWKKSEFLNLL